MALKTATGKLYTLFSACFPENVDVKKNLLIEKIVGNEKYRALCVYEPMSDYIRKNWSKEQLKTMTYDGLCELEKVVPIIQDTVDLLIKSISYSNAWELTYDDKPDFTSYESVSNLKNKLENEVVGRNITNITQANYMDIFSERLISNVDEIMDCFTIEQMQNAENEIVRTISDRPYCIPYKAVEDRQREIELAVADIEQLDINSKIIRRKIWGRKMWVVAFSLIVFCCVFATGAIYSAGFSVFALGLIILDIVYLVVG